MTMKAQRLSKIEFYGLGERVTNMLFGETPKTPAEISKILKDENPEWNISPSAIYGFREMLVNHTREQLLKKPELRENLSEKLLDTVTNLVFALKEIKDKIEEYKETKNWKAHSTYLNLLLKECDQLLKRAGEIKPSQIVKEMNIVQINQAIQIQIAELIDSGDIPLESCSLKIQDWYKKIKKKKGISHENG